MFMQQSYALMTLQMYAEVWSPDGEGYGYGGAGQSL